MTYNVLSGTLNRTQSINYRAKPKDQRSWRRCAQYSEMFSFTLETAFGGWDLSGRAGGAHSTPPDS